MRRLLPFCLVTSLCFSCKENSPEKVIDSLDDYPSSYALIQGEIWDKSCIDCHVAGSSFARQSDLVLTADVSYDQLINRQPTNVAALEDGLLLVGDQGLESLYSSFLWEKINAPDQEHFYDDHPNYGSIMPLGGDPLTNGQLEFIRQWIVKGAPKSGVVVDIAVLADESVYEIPDFEPLPLPEQGLQFHVAPFEIPANTDRELFIYQELNNAEQLYIKSFEITMAPGSHHFILYNFDENLATNIYPQSGLIRDVYNDNGGYNFATLYYTQFHQFVVGTQWPKTRYTFPEGVALPVPANSGFDVNSHYANRSDAPIMGEVYANIHTVNQSEVVYEAKILNLNNNEFSLPAGQVTTLEKEFKFSEERHVFQLWSHAHSHMVSFKVFIAGGDRDGELIYVAYDWEHPPILQLDPPLVLNAGEGFRLETTYDNDEDRALGFGLRSTDEMMILFGAYYETN